MQPVDLRVSATWVKTSEHGALLIGGRDGWCHWERGGKAVRLRVQEVSRDRFQVTALAVGALGRREPPQRVTGELLRDLPVGAVERTINLPGIAAAVRVGLRSDRSPDLRPGQLLPTAVDSEPLTLFEPEGVDDELRLTIPPGRRPDSFYAEVLDKLERASAWSRSPAKELARVNGKPVTTVHRWIREAKRRDTQPAMFE